MKKRLISLLLAFSMMLTFLPAGAVSAFAEGTADDTTKGELLTDGKTITESGTYQLNGPYKQGITINTQGSVEINVTGEVTGELPHPKWGAGDPLISIQAGTVNFNGDSRYPVTVNGGSVISNKGGNLTLNGGKYSCSGNSSAFTLSNGINQVENVTIESKYDAIDVTYNCDSAVIENSEITKQYEGSAYEGGIVCRTTNGTLDLNHVTVHALEGNALELVCGTITIEEGEYTASDGGFAIRAYPENDDAIDLTITGGTYISKSEYAVAGLTCYGNKGSKRSNIKINGSKLIGNNQALWFEGESAGTLTIDGNTTLQSTGGTRDAVVVGNGQLIFNSGTIEVSGGSERAALRTYDTGEAIVNDGTFKGAKYDIYERYRYDRMPPCRVQLNHANFDDDVCNVYLEKDRQIDVAQNYTGQVTIECADPKDGRQLTKATKTNYQEKLNLTSANAGYLVGYKKTADGKGEYRCLSKEVGVTINDLKGEIKAEDTAEFTVTLTHENSTGTGILTFGDKNSEIEYKDKNGAYQPMPKDPKDGLEVDLSGNNKNYEFRITPKDAGDQTLTAAVVRDAVELGTADKNFTVADRVHTAVTIEGLENAVIKEGESKDFTVKVDPKDDAKLGEAFIDFGDKNSEIEYLDDNGAYQPMPDGGLEIDLGNGETKKEFRITPKDAGDQKLTAAVVRDAVEVGKDSETYQVAGRVHTAVTIEGLENAVIKEGESKDFTVKVDPKDDTGKGKIDFGGKNGEVQYKDGDDWKDMPADGLEIDLDDGAKDYEFRITPKETGKQTLTAAVKQGENKLATDEKDFVVSEMPILTLKDGVITSVTVPGKNGADPEDITEIVKKNANEDGSFHVPEGATVSVAFDKDAFADSGLKFGHWDITGLDDPNAYQDKESFAFVMPAKAVTLKAMTQDASIEDDEPDIVGPIVIGTTVVVGGAVLGYQAYSLGAEFAGKLMNLPYFPSNRSALAMMLWEDAGKPMPEPELLYPDVGQEERDMDLQHAARWAMENELIPDLNDEGTAPEEMKFYPDNAVSKIDVLNAWQKAQELKQNA